jgi:uncharacterized protein (DUF1800 family)
VLRLGALAAAIGALPGCDVFVEFAGGASPTLEPLPDRISLPAGKLVDPAFHFLSRATFGPRPGDVDRFRRIGRDAWLDEQLHPQRIDDWRLMSRLSECELTFDLPHDLESVNPRHIEEQLNRAALLRAVNSRRQLQEVMVAFWTDHFSIDVGKKGCMQAKPLDDHEVLRPHALRKFRDLVRGSALSAAMLIYLDGRENRKRSPDEAPNENYARELLELHTLGVHGGYTQKDVMEAARCLTGWTIDGKRARSLETLFRTNDVVFRPDWHDDGEKLVLGRRIPAGGGAGDLDDLIDTVARHPSTALHIAHKLCRRFVSDPPPEDLVESTAYVFHNSDGDVKYLLRHILTSQEFADAVGRKVKRPFRFLASAMRTLGAESRADRREIEFLERLGHVPHHYPTPDGYPEEPEPWMGTLLWRWNFALALTTGRLGRTKTDLRALARAARLDPRTSSPAEIAPLLYGRAATDEERDVVDRFVGGGERRKEEAVALLLSAPAFQVY